MPTYEFRCPDGTIVERIFKMSEVPQTIPSPNGDGDAVRIISGGAGLLFKGTGFYITDYGKDGKKDQRQASNESASKDSPGEKAEGTKGEAAKAAAPASSGSGSDGGSASSTAATGTASAPAKPAGGAPTGSTGTSKKSDDS